MSSSNPADTSLATNIVEGSKRVYKKLTLKKEPVSPEIVSRIGPKYAGSPTDVKGLRSALIFLLGFSGSFCIGELLDLRAKDVAFATEHLEIAVRKS